MFEIKVSAIQSLAITKDRYQYNLPGITLFVQLFKTKDKL